MFGLNPAVNLSLPLGCQRPAVNPEFDCGYLASLRQTSSACASSARA